LIDPTPGVPNQIYNVIDNAVEYDFPTSAIEVNVPYLSVQAGNLVDIPVTVFTNGQQLNALQFGLKYDEAVLEFKNIYATSAAMKWLTYVNPNNGEVNWGGYDPTNNTNPIGDGDEVIRIQFLALAPQSAWTESPLWTTDKYAGNLIHKDLAITPANGVLQVVKSTIGDVIDLNTIELYPNPVSNEVAITFNVANGSLDATLAVYDLQGRKVVTILSGQVPAGQYTYVKNLGHLAPGMYVVNLSSDTNASIVEKLIKD
jgi:hypothetical protein